MVKHRIEDFYAFRIGNMWSYFARENFSFWMMCCYLFVEYFRPQSIYPAIDVLPWAQLFLTGALVGMAMDRSVKWVSSPVNVWLIIFAVVIYLSSLFAFFPEISREHYIDFYSWFVIYFLIITVINTKERFYIFAMILLFCSAKIAVGTSMSWASRGFSFTDWGLMGPRGYFQNSGELSILMLTLFPLSFNLLRAMQYRKARRWEKAVLLVFTIAPIMTILGASSRGAQIALVVVLGMMFRRSIFRMKPLVAIAASVFIAWSVLPEEQKQRFTEIGEDRTSEQRMLYLENGWDMMRENPVLGVGFFNFPRYFALNYPEDVITISRSAELAHNIFIQVGTDAGFLGLVVFLALIAAVLKTAFRNSRREEPGEVLPAISAGLGYGIVGFVVAGQFVTVAYYPFLWIGAAMVVSLDNVLRSSGQPIKSGVATGPRRQFTTAS